MNQIILTPEQAAQLQQAAGPFVLVDPCGKAVGSVGPPPVALSHFTPAEIAEAEAGIGREGRGITSAELLSRLRKLSS